MESPGKCWNLAGSSLTPQKFAQVYCSMVWVTEKSRALFSGYSSHFFVAPTWCSSWSERVVINTCLCRLCTKASQDAFGGNSLTPAWWWRALLTLLPLRATFSPWCCVTTHNPCSLPLLQVMLYKTCQLREGRAQFSRACITRRGFAGESSCWMHSLAADVASLFLKTFVFLNLTRYCLTV